MKLAGAEPSRNVGSRTIIYTFIIIRTLGAEPTFYHTYEIILITFMLHTINKKFIFTIFSIFSHLFKGDTFTKNIITLLTRLIPNTMFHCLCGTHFTACVVPAATSSPLRDFHLMHYYHAQRLYHLNISLALPREYARVAYTLKDFSQICEVLEVICE